MEKRFRRILEQAKDVVVAEMEKMSPEERYVFILWMGHECNISPLIRTPTDTTNEEEDAMINSRWREIKPSLHLQG